MYEGELERIEKHLRDGDYSADIHSLRAIHLLLEEVKRLRNECAHFQQHETHYHQPEPNVTVADRVGQIERAAPGKARPRTTAGSLMP